MSARTILGASVPDIITENTVIEIPIGAVSFVQADFGWWWRLDVSRGVAICGTGHPSLDDAIANADRALGDFVKRARAWDPTEGRR